MQRQRQRRLHASARQALEHAAVPHGGEHEILVPQAADRPEQLDRLEHIVEVVCRLAHPHEHHLAHRPEAASQHDLGQDLGAAKLPYQALAPRHAEDAADRAADLGGHAQSIAG